MPRETGPFPTFQELPATPALYAGSHPREDGIATPPANAGLPPPANAGLNVTQLPDHRTGQLFKDLSAWPKLALLNSSILKKGLVL